MNIYLIPITKAIITFPIIAFIITLPFMIINYNKYGSISKLRTLIIYSFILYLLCAFFLVILPLPSKEYVNSLTIPYYQLKPFNFINDLINNIDFKINSLSSLIKLLKTNAFYQPLFNIVLTMPFGIYLRYYYKCSFKKTFFLSLLLTLFFEITQLTGIYGIYSRNYRMFDVDDIMFNTIGGILGYLIGGLFIKILPSRENIDNKSLILGQKVSGIRRLIAFIIDSIFMNILFVILLIISLIFDNNVIHLSLIYLVSSYLIYVIVPLIFKGFTLGKRIVKIRIDSNKLYLIFIRTNLMFISVFLLPYIIFLMLIDGYITGLLLIPLYFIFILITIYQLLSNKLLWYEKLTKTKNKSVIKYEE